jgi:hypothetical protein
MRAREMVAMRGIWAGAVAAMVALSACGDGSGSGPDSTGSSAPASATVSPSRSPSGSPTPVAYGRATLVTGTVRFSIDQGTVTTDPDGSEHSRNGITTSTLTCNDPRVAGEVVESWNSDRWGQGPANGSLVQWGTSRLTNGGGTWVGKYTGAATTQTSDLITWWYTGTGEYAGLSFFMWITESNSGTWRGLLFPGKPPTP